ncbi:hypothetical protein N9996_04315 [Synechococcus sp. AH-603-M21]|nr:hypothetical protein [Synechococcus sp. AH-603-M21]
MAFFNINGNGTLDLIKIDTNPPKSKNTTIQSISLTSIRINLELDIDGDGNYRKTTITANGFFTPSLNGELNGTVTRISVKTDDNYLNIEIKDFTASIEDFIASQDDESALRALGLNLLSNNDTINGSNDGGSLIAELYEGNDNLFLSSGLFNNVNTNAGEDLIEIKGGSGKVLGGSDKDTILYLDGEFTSINGNKGDDLINLEGGQGIIFGGKDSDTINLEGGSFTYINGNKGTDIINIRGGEAERILGGADADQITNFSGQFTTINGNKGEDTIINNGSISSILRGGADNDLLINNPGANGEFYGDLGADTFKLSDQGVMTIKDFDIENDSIDFSNLESYNTRIDGDNTLVETALFGVVAILENIIL